jgi:hypothetical protein
LKKNILREEVNVSYENISLDQFIKEEVTELSNRKLVNDLNDIAAILHMPNVTVTMFTRLKQEPPNTVQKRNLLRLLAAWFALNREHPTFNYKMILLICTKEERLDDTRGVRIVFNIRGDFINQNDLESLKSEIKDCLYDLHLSQRKLESYIRDTPKVFLDMPIKYSSSAFIHPKVFGQTIRDAIALSIQVYNRWMMSKLSEDKSLVVGLIVGDFNKHLDISLQALVDANLPDKAIIRATDITRIYVRTADIRVMFCQRPEEVEVTRSYKIRVWWIENFWNYIYWGFNISMLTTLPPTLESYRTLKGLLRFFNDDMRTYDSKTVQVIQKVFHRPHRYLS